jgi:hypothetical protein
MSNQTLQTWLYVIGFISFLCIFGFGYLLWKFQSTQKKLSYFLLGKNGADLETLILSIQDNIKNLQAENLTASTEIQELKQISQLCIQKVGLVRYSPFLDGGGNYSFSLALLNHHYSGIIITNMYGRQQSRVYIKQITQGKSDIVLTEEEQTAIQTAKFY